MTRTTRISSASGSSTSGPRSHTTTAQIYLVDDHPAAWSTVQEQIGPEPGMEIMGRSDSAEKALEDLKSKKVDLILHEVRLKTDNGFDLIRRLKATRSEAHVLVYSMLEETTFAKGALIVGASGYVMKTAPRGEFIHAIRVVLAGGTYLSYRMRMKERAPTAPIRHMNKYSTLDRMSSREREIFLLIGQGYAPRQIVDKMDLGARTFEVYRARLRQKLGIENSDVLRRYAVRWYADHRK